MTSTKVAVYSLPDLKNTTDDALPNYLTSLKFKQSHSLTDVRLALGYMAVMIAGITFYIDYKLGWDKTKASTLWAVIAYFVLNSVLTYWIWGVEKGKVFTGDYEGTQLSITSHVKKHTPIYNLTVRYLECNTTNGTWETLELSAPFTQWFDAEGHFVSKPFQQWLASGIAIIGKADPKSLTVASGHTLEKKMEAEPLDEPENVQETGIQKGSSAGSGVSGSSRSRKAKR